MIGREGQFHHLPWNDMSFLDNCPIFDPTDCQNGSLRRVDDSGELRDPVHSEIGYRKRAAHILFASELSFTSTSRQAFNFLRELAHVFKVCMADDGSNESRLHAHSDRDIDRLKTNDCLGYGIEPSIDIRMLPEGERCRSHHKIIKRDLQSPSSEFRTHRHKPVY